MTTEMMGRKGLGQYRPYPEYQDSGVEWLGEIPLGWTVVRLKGVASVGFSTVDKKSYEGQRTVRVCNYVDVYYNDYISADIAFKTATASDKEIENFTLRKGDVILTKDSETWDDIAVPAYVQEDTEDLVCGYHLALVRPEKVTGEFLFRALSARGVCDQLWVAANGVTRFGLSRAKLCNSLISVPRDDDQLAIAAFLDRETAKIDALIEKKERLIELLQEKRTALITHAVTNGLDPGVAMKDSGVEWLGEIPVHWEVVRLRFLLLGGLQNGLFKKNEHFGQGLKLVNVKDLYADDYFVCFKELGRVEADEKEGRIYSVAPGDIFFVRSSLKLEGVARSACIQKVGEPTVFECHLVRGRPNKSYVVAEYLIYFLNSVLARQRQIAASITTTMSTISQQQLASLEILLPSRTEQRIIAAYLKQKTAEADALVKKIHTGIGRLKEYRTALISAAVTGKIDVREEVA